MTDQASLRDRAVQRLKAKRHFWSALITWLALSAMFIVIWAVTGMGGFWPVWPIAGIAIGVVATGIRAFGPGSTGPSESDIQAEMRRLSCKPKTPSGAIRPPSAAPSRRSRVPVWSPPVNPRRAVDSAAASTGRVKASNAR